MKTIRIAALLAAALTAPSAAQVSFPVDDFEVQGFQLLQSGPGSVADVQIIAASQSGHVISNTREVFCIGGLNPETFAQATFVPGSAGDDQMLAQIGTDGSVVVAYPIGFPVDLTVSGGVDRISFHVTASSEGRPVTVVLVDENDDFASASVPITTAGDEEIPLSAFTGVDLENVVEIIFRLDEPGSYSVRDVRLRGAGSQGVDFDIHAEATQTPPLPTPPVLATIFEAPFVNPLFDLGVSLVDANAGFLPQLLLGLGVEPSADGQRALMFLQWEDLAPFDAVDVAFSFDFASSGDLIPELYPPDPVHGPEGVTVPLLVGLRDGVGGPTVGMSEGWLTIDPAAQQAESALSFENVMVTLNAQPAGGMATGFTVSMLLLPGAAGVETIWPVLDMNLWMDWTPLTVTDTPVVAAPGESRGLLTAVPSVTSGATEIRCTRPFAAGARLLVHDVGGRRVATVPVTGGARVASWSGRGRDGRSVPAGVYFVRLEGSATRATRVVKLR